MLDVYGAEEASVKFVVTGVTRDDCDHLTATYRVVGATEVQKATLARGSDASWRLEFYKKQYPVR